LVLAPAAEYCAALDQTDVPVVVQTVVGQTVQTVVVQMVVVQMVVVQTVADETVAGLWVAAQPAVLPVSLFCGSQQKALTIPLGTAD